MAWILDQQINDRGIRVDRPTTIAALDLVDKARQRLDEQMADATGGGVRACTESARLARWLEAQDFKLDGVAKDDVLEALDLEDCPENVRKVLEIRQAAAKTSTAKIAKMLEASAVSGRLKHQFRYHGTAPGRWSSLGVNIANLPRPRKEYSDAVEEGLLDVNQSFEIIRSGSPDMLEAVYGPELGRPMDFLADSLRGFLFAEPGHDLVAVDYSSIQGCLAAWFAGERWKLAAIQEILDNPKLPDLYRRTAAGILNTTTHVVTKKHWGRQIGKVAELALGFAGGVKALVSMARNYALRKRQLHELYPGVWAAASEENREKAVKRYEQVSRSRNREDSDVLTREAWIACSLIVRGWRQTNPAIAASWSELEGAVRSAVREPGVEIETLKGVRYVVKRGSLWCRLPSGRCIHYPAPKLKDQVWARLRLADGSFGESEVVDGDEARAAARRGDARIEGETSPKVTVLGREGSGKMARYALYGGLIMENCLGKNTKVLTKSRGWVRITDITCSDMLWDGLEWVRHNGLLSQGRRSVIRFDGVVVTPNHKMWNGHEWTKAKDADVHQIASASQNTESMRAALRPPHGAFVRWWRWPKELVAHALRLRRREDAHRFRTTERFYHQLRLLCGRNTKNHEQNAWHVEAPMLCNMEVNGRSMSTTYTPSMEKLRCSRNHSVRALASVYKFLERCFAWIQKRFEPGASRQRSRIFSRQLLLGDAESAVAKSTQQRLCRDAKRSDANVRSSRTFWSICRVFAGAYSARLADALSLREAEKGVRHEALVYDIADAGPRNRFTILGSNGRTFIVSNCCLASERDILLAGMQACEENGYPIVFHCYDEAVAEIPRGQGSVEEMVGLMLRLPAWTRGLPLGAAGWRGKRYRK
jgi:hypothetical protein